MSEETKIEQEVKPAELSEQELDNVAGGARVNSELENVAATTNTSKSNTSSF